MKTFSHSDSIVVIDGADIIISLSNLGMSCEKIDQTDINFLELSEG